MCRPKKIKIIAFVWLLLLQTLNPGMVYADKKPDKKTSKKSFLNNGRHKVGFMTGYGFQSTKPVCNIKAEYCTYDYFYKVVFFQLEYHYLATAKPKWNLEIIGQPQYNISWYKLSESPRIMRHGYEVGFTGGVLARLTISPNISVYSGVMSGPQYVPYLPERQATGFIFSDNFFFRKQYRIEQEYLA